MTKQYLLMVVALSLVLFGVVAPADSLHARAGEPPSAKLPAPPSEAAPPSYDQLPLLFIENRGQTDPQVAFTLQGNAATLYFTPSGVTYTLVEPRALGRAARRWAVKLDFVGANPSSRPIGQQRAETVVSYFRGRPEEWHTGLRTYRRIVYPDLWPGIDLAYSSSGGALKYEFVVHPGADPAQIRLAYRGTDRVTLNEAGQLEVNTPVGGFADDLPVAWQEGPGGRSPVAVSYDLPLTARSAEFQAASHAARATGFGFQIGSYDPARTLVLDPVVLLYAGYIGGFGNDEGHSIAVDHAGNAYVTGFTVATQATFPVVAGPDLTFNGVLDAFVAKIDLTGTTLLYAGYIGGAQEDRGQSIAIDSEGNAYVTGITASDQTTFPVVAGPDLTYNGGGYDAFVAKVNASGTALLYAGYIGGSDSDKGSGIAVREGSAYVAGETYSGESSFPVLVGPDLTHNGGDDAFVARVNPAGTALLYAGYIGGATDDRSYGIAVDGDGGAYMTGETSSDQNTFPAAVGPDLDYNGNLDAFVAKVNSAGTSIVYAGYIGGAWTDSGAGIAVDAAGNAYVTGSTASDETTFPAVVGPDLTYNGSSADAFVAKINPAGSALLYAGYIGGAARDHARDIAVSSDGDAFATGYTSSDQVTFPVLGGPDLTYNGGFSDAFVGRINRGGSALVSVGYIGGADADLGNAIALLDGGYAYVTGQTSSNEETFPVLGGPDLTYNLSGDAFVAKVHYLLLQPVLWLPLIMQ